MKVYTEVSYEGVLNDSDRVVLLLRRVGGTVGFLFGLGLLALLMASNASAEEAPRSVDGSATGQSLLGSVTGVLSPGAEAGTPVTGLVDGVAPVVRPVTELVAPVVRPVTEVVAPVLRPVTEAVGPVLRPVTALVAPVTEAVAPVLRPVTEVVAPVLRPVTEVVAPVLRPVTETVLLPVVGAVAPGMRAETVPVVQQRQPETVVLTDTSSWLDDGVATGTVLPARDVVDDASASVASVDPAGPGQTPNAPVGPVGVAPGSGGSFGGFGGAHGADAAVSSLGGLLPRNDSSGRAPPGAIVGQPWFGYATRDHPR
jgi:hypothetical protein